MDMASWTIRNGRPFPKMETVALKLFQICDDENKGFIEKRDMEKLQDETGLTSDQLHTVFETLDVQKNGFLTFQQFLDGFREYSINTNIDERSNHIHVSQNDELSNTLRLIKETNILKTSADELEYICEQLKDGGELSHWDGFMKDLNQDLQTYKNAHMRLECIMKRKDIEHQNYVRKIFEEIEGQLKQEKDKEAYDEMEKRKVREEIKKLQVELLAKDELLQHLNTECKELKNQLHKVQKKEEEMNVLNSILISQKNAYEMELEKEREEKNQFYTLVKNIRRRYSIEKCQSFNDGFNLARKIISVQEEGLMQQLRILQDMQSVLNSRHKDENPENSEEKLKSPSI